MKKTVTCRPCKDKPGTWEIEDQNGVVKEKHYASKSDCVCDGSKIACECGCELCIEEQPKQN